MASSTLGTAINYYFNLHIVCLFAYLSLVDKQQVNSVPFVGSSLLAFIIFC